MMQGGDWSHWVGRELGSRLQQGEGEGKGSGCRLVHFNFAPSPLPEGVELTARESEVQGRVDDWLERHMGYAVCMRTRVSLLFSFPLILLMVLLMMMVVALGRTECWTPDWH